MIEILPFLKVLAGTCQHLSSDGETPIAPGDMRQSADSVLCGRLSTGAVHLPDRTEYAGEQAQEQCHTGAFALPRLLRRVRVLRPPLRATPAMAVHRPTIIATAQGHHPSRSPTGEPSGAREVADIRFITADDDG